MVRDYQANQLTPGSLNTNDLQVKEFWVTHYNHLNNKGPILKCISTAGCFNPITVTETAMCTRHTLSWIARKSQALDVSEKRLCDPTVHLKHLWTNNMLIPEPKSVVNSNISDHTLRIPQRKVRHAEVTERYHGNRETMLLAHTIEDVENMVLFRRSLKIRNLNRSHSMGFQRVMDSLLELETVDRSLNPVFKCMETSCFGIIVCDETHRCTKHTIEVMEQWMAADDVAALKSFVRRDYLMRLAEENCTGDVLHRLRGLTKSREKETDSFPSRELQQSREFIFRPRCIYGGKSASRLLITNQHSFSRDRVHSQSTAGGTNRSCTSRIITWRSAAACDYLHQLLYFKLLRMLKQRPTTPGHRRN